MTARAGNRRFGRLSALRAHTKTPYKTDLHRNTLMELNRPGTARTVPQHPADVEGEGPRDAVPLRRHLRLYPIVTAQYSSTALYQVSDHLQSLCS
jgi:hypothetical protein